MGKRQRADGTWTYTTEEWDAEWYWPVGTRVRVVCGPFDEVGTVTKENTVSMRVRFDNVGPERLVQKRAHRPQDRLVRL